MKPALPKGTRDFLPEEVRKRRFIFDTIRNVFELYGYDPIETPAMESLSTLMGKYGEEGDRLLFKILNNGDYLSKADPVALKEKDSQILTSSISKRGLRYDLTVPFARFVVMHQNNIQFPFKRYQIQQVWRADRPQKGRYQEFYQCDADIVGSDSLLYEAELVSIYDEVFTKLNIQVTIKCNHRKILFGIAEVAGIADKLIPMTVAIDKLDKIGKSGVKIEMAKSGIDDFASDKILSILNIQNISELGAILESSKEGMEGIGEIEEFYGYLHSVNHSNSIIFDPKLARGLGYYTGCIFEVVAHDVKIGSIGGGGRYANLTGVFGLDNVSGVGISFGAERIYDVMEELGLFTEVTKVSSKAIFLSFDKKALNYSYRQAAHLRTKNIAIEVYPSPVKMNKQMKYANNRGIPFVVIVGDQEMESGELTLKNMVTGEECKVVRDELLNKLGEE